MLNKVNTVICLIAFIKVVNESNIQKKGLLRKESVVQ